MDRPLQANGDVSRFQVSFKHCHHHIAAQIVSRSSAT
jgi:hypothetical protein